MTYTRALELIRDGDLDAASDLAHTIEGVPGQMVRGAIALRRHDWLSAHDHFQAAHRIEPDDVMPLINLGMAQYELGFWDACAGSCEAVLLRQINNVKAWRTLGACHGMRARWADALACLERAIGLDPDDAANHQSMGMICSTLGYEDGAEHHYREAMRLDPALAQAECGLGATLLRSGKWIEGWKHFESRWRLPTPVAPWWYRGQPLYDGDLEGLRGKRVLLRSEQGFGDSIHFARYIEPLSKIAGSLVLETQAELARLFAHLPCEIVIAPKMENQVRAVDGVEFDFQTSLMSLPLLFGTTPETMPPPVNLGWMHAEVTPATIGVCWAGGGRPEDPQAHEVDRRRSIPRETFQPVIDHIGLARSLQQKDMTPGDWLNTANVIKGLSLVITVDTAVAHLAASLGIETWMLSRFDACWRFGLTGETTPWYPSMKIYRQPRLGDWESVVKRVVADLEKRR